ncbi:MAG: hypothetical protein AB7G37_11805, partial [Solirubrobacteraceae bacterium]
ITVLGGGGAGAGPSTPTYDGPVTVEGRTLTSSGAHWAQLGFVYGQIVRIGLEAKWTVTSVNGTKLGLSGPELPAGLDVGTVRIEGFAPSPLVVFGGTSQDGTWYSGDTEKQVSRSFGSKPYPSQLGNGTPAFVFPVAAPFRYFGNNVIDASRLYAGAAADQVPAFGITAYGGAGNDVIIGSRTRDILVGGSGGDVITGANAVIGDLVDQNSGVNVDIVTRALALPTTNYSAHAVADPLVASIGLVPMILGLPPTISGLVNGIVGGLLPGLPPLLPAIPGVTVTPGTTRPPTPTVTLDPADRSVDAQGVWVTSSRNPRFVVIPALLTSLPLYANGQYGYAVKVYLNGVLQTREPLADGDYVVTATLTDYYGNTSALATGVKILRVDGSAPAPPGGASQWGLPPSGGPVSGLAQLLVPGGAATSELSLLQGLSPVLAPALRITQDLTTWLLAPLAQQLAALGLSPAIPILDNVNRILAPLEVVLQPIGELLFHTFADVPPLPLPEQVAPSWMLPDLDTGIVLPPILPDISWAWTLVPEVPALPPLPSRPPTDPLQIPVPVNPDGIALPTWPAGVPLPEHLAWPEWMAWPSWLGWPPVPAIDPLDLPVLPGWDLGDAPSWDVPDLLGGLDALPWPEVTPLPPLTWPPVGDGPSIDPPDDDPGGDPSDPTTGEPGTLPPLPEVELPDAGGVINAVLDVDLDEDGLDVEVVGGLVGVEVGTGGIAVEVALPLLGGVRIGLF